MTDFPDRNLDVLRERTASGAPSHPLDAIAKGLEREGGQLVLARGNGEWTVGLHFGQEDPDSEMAAGASYAIDPSLHAALRKVLVETGWDRPRVAAQEDDGDQD